LAELGTGPAARPRLPERFLALLTLFILWSLDDYKSPACSAQTAVKKQALDQESLGLFE